MSIATEITRVEGLRDALRTALVALGLVDSDALLDACVAAVQAIQNRGAAQGSISDADTPYTIQAGYHNGSGQVSIASTEKAKIVPGNIKQGVVLLGVTGSYTGEGTALQSKTVTPTKQQQEISADDGYDALSTVTVLAIPAAYQDVSGVTATAADVLATKIIVDKTGAKVPGMMPNNGAVDRTLDAATQSYTVDEGYHNGEGTVKIVPETKSATPSKSSQTVTPTAGKVLTQVDVAAIPAAFQDVTGVTAAAPDVLTGKTIVDATGKEVAGTMPDNGAISKQIDGLTETSASIPAGHTSGGTVSLTNDIEDALAAI